MWMFTFWEGEMRRKGSVTEAYRHSVSWFISPGDLRKFRIQVIFRIY